MLVRTIHTTYTKDADGDAAVCATATPLSHHIYGRYSPCNEILGNTTQVEVEKETQLKKQYFGDRRDYIKYSILRHLLEHEVSCMVCWMMTPDERNNQGAQKGYLKRPDKFKKFDPEVFCYLKEQLHSQSPDIHSMERAGPIAQCHFYWEPFPSEPTAPSHPAKRESYFDGCLKKAENTDLVFLDADIGPMPFKSRPKAKEKYVLWDEITRVYCAGHSVMVFNYLQGGTGQKNARAVERCEKLQDELPNAYVTVIRTHDLAFYFAVHPEHRQAVDSAIATVVRAWKDLCLWEVRCD